MGWNVASQVNEWLIDTLFGHLDTVFVHSYK
jgi:imidazoleglycerol phosphate synthase glutamine amidotransferase subunit HisH